MKTCKYEGCIGKAVGKGLCKRHWRWQHEAKTFADRKDRICLHCFGPIPAIARIDQKFCGLSCKMKWHRREGSYTRAAIIENRGICSVDACGDALHADGLCRSHYMRKWRHGDASFIPEKCRPKGMCEFDGCSKAADFKHLCKQHYMKRYIEKNRAEWNINHSARRTRVKSASPPWVDWKAIRRIYAQCARVTADTGVEHHVDHIIPIKGKNVCGLHVPWNLQILPGAENRRKSNTV
jgi:hypothetical protein